MRTSPTMLELQRRARDHRDRGDDSVARYVEEFCLRCAAGDVPRAWLMRAGESSPPEVSDRHLAALVAACPPLTSKARALRALLDMGVPRPVVLCSAADSAVRFSAFWWLPEQSRHELREWLATVGWSSPFVADLVEDIRRSLP